MSRYADTKINKVKIDSSNNSVQKYETTIYQEIPETNDDIFVVTQEGDRLDNLASRFYGNPQLWWFIARVNNLKTNNIPAGTSLRIPTTKKDAEGL